MFLKLSLVLCFFNLLFTAGYTRAESINFVYNGSFEEFSNCPTSSSALNTGNNIGWSGVSTEYYSTRQGCTDQTYDFTENYGGGSQEVATETSGDTYAGIRIAASMGGYRERIYGTLTEPLTPGIHYRFQYKVSLSDGSNACSSGFGMGALGSIPSPMPTGPTLPEVSTLGTTSNMVCDMTGWETIEGIFTATAPDTHIVIGGMTPTAEYQMLPVGFGMNSYYYLDDVRLTCEAGATFTVPEHPPCNMIPSVTVQSAHDFINHTWTLTTPSGETYTQTASGNPHSISLTTLFPEELFEADGDYTLSLTGGCHPSDQGVFGPRTFTLKHSAPAPTNILPVQVHLGQSVAGYVQSPYSVNEDLAFYQTGNFTAQGTYTAPNGCTTEVSLPFIVLPETPEMLEQKLESFYAPNSFSPNGDNLNEAWFPEGQNVNYDLIILDRWGSVIFEVKDKPIEESNNYAWTGGVRGGQHTESGTYVYQATYRGRYTTEAKTVSGTINLIR